MSKPRRLSGTNRLRLERVDHHSLVEAMTPHGGLLLRSVPVQPARHSHGTCLCPLPPVAVLPRPGLGARGWSELAEQSREQMGKTLQTPK